MSTKGLVLVTGVSGFVASHVAKRLLAEGYAVRGTARGERLETLKSAPIAQDKNFQLVQVDDIATSDLSQAMQDVKFIMHIASPLAGKASAADSLQAAVQGTLNVLRQAVHFGISKVVLTSSWGTIMDPTLPKVYMSDVVLTDQDWGNVTEAELLSNASEKGIMWTYLSVKILAEKAAWKFANENPSLDLATINPPFVYGPLAEGFPKPAPDRMGVMSLLFSLVKGPPGRPLPPQIAPVYCDVRDVARAHVNALTVAPTEKKEDKRYFIVGGSFTWSDAVNYLARTRPQIKDQLVSLEGAPQLPPVSKTDVSRARTVLHIDEYIAWEKTVDDTIDSYFQS